MKLVAYPASSVDYAKLRSTTCGQALVWDNDPATFVRSLCALSTIGPVVLEWRYTEEPESSKSDTEPKKNF